jgi:hypothetical protein
MIDLEIIIGKLYVDWRGASLSGRAPPSSRVAASHVHQGGGL